MLDKCVVSKFSLFFYCFIYGPVVTFLEVVVLSFVFHGLSTSINGLPIMSADINVILDDSVMTVSTVAYSCPQFSFAL
jgi:hypothetical protein